jgi:hypothetical protein
MVEILSGLFAVFVSVVQQPCEFTIEVRSRYIVILDRGAKNMAVLVVIRLFGELCAGLRTEGGFPSHSDPPSRAETDESP